MSLILPIAGAYAGTWDGKDLGILSDDGYELSMQVRAQEINDTDQFGMTLIEAIYRGQDWRVRFRGKEAAKEGIVAVLMALGTAGGGGIAPALGIIGVTMTSKAQALVLTATTGTPADVALDGPQSLTADYASLSPSNNTAMLMTSKVKEVPIEMVCFPYASSGENIPFSIT
jgi:hypothetical protein